MNFLELLVHAEIRSIIILEFFATFSSANLSIAYSLFDKVSIELVAFRMSTYFNI